MSAQSCKVAERSPPRPSLIKTAEIKRIPVNSGCEVTRRARNTTRQLSPDGPGPCSPDGYGFWSAIEAKFKLGVNLACPFLRVAEKCCLRDRTLHECAD